MTVNAQFYVLDIDHDSLGNVKLFGRTANGGRICAIDDSIRPFFYVLAKKDIKELNERISKLVVKEKDEFYRVVKTTIERKNYLDREVEAIKVEVNKPGSVKVIKDVVKGMHDVEDKIEIDINLDKRYLIEKDIIPLCLCEVEGEAVKDEHFLCIKGHVKPMGIEEMKEPKSLAMDIEVYAKDAFGGSAKEPILIIGFSGNNGFKKVVTWKRFNNAPEYVEFVEDEKEMIERAKQIIKKYNPDYIVGYNSDGFDLPYIKERAELHKIKLDIGADGSNLNFKRGGNDSVAKIRGIPHIDIFQFIRNIMAGSLQLDSYSLDVVANELLKEGKDKSVNVRKIGESWDKGDMREFCVYNLKDTELTLRVFEEVLPNLNELVKLIGMPIFNVCRMRYGQLVENYLIRKAKEFNEMCPNRPISGEISERMMHTYQGAFVMEPKAGFYENMAILDFKSLYPTIIVAKNICPSMLNKKEGYKSPEIEHESGKKVHYYFSSKKEGFIPKIIKDLIIRRNRIKEMLKKDPKNVVLKARSYALKTVANSSYGYMGFSGSRWYSRECAASITAWAREYIQSVIKRAEKDFNVIYSDTDSVAIALENKTHKDALKFLEEVNKELPSLMELELEDFYERGIFVMKKGEESHGAKKKYALINRHGDLKIRGFETVRRDWSAIARETQLEVLKIILKEKSPEKALKFVRKAISDVNDYKIPMEKMIIQTRLKMNISDYKQIGPHVAVAKKMIKKGIHVEAGSSLVYVIGEGKGMIRDRAMLPDECKKYDSEYYVENQIIPCVEKIFEVFGIKKEELMNRGSQKGLSSFIK